jgi:hypothetical protein
MKNTKTHKISKLTKSEYHNDVMPAFVTYRREMHKACNVYTSDYIRLFTEQRTYGARSKYWLSRKSLPEQRIHTYVQNNPTFTTAAGRTFTVTAENVAGWRGADFALFCNLSK